MARDMVATLNEPAAASDQAAEWIAAVAKLLFVNGQTTEATRTTVERLGRRLGLDASLSVRWGEVTLLLNGRPSELTLEANPVSVDMGRIVGAERMVDDFCGGRLTFERARTCLETVERAAPVSSARFVLMAAFGATALGVIFGASDPATLLLIALSAGIGAAVRRALSRYERNPLVQPLCAALLAGLIGAVTKRLGVAPDAHLVMACPCMVLVPGPHVLNGTIDLARVRIAIGAARITFAGLVVLMICTGLMLGLWLGGATLPKPSSAITVPLAVDVVAAGVAVSAFGSFFNMPWRMLPLPIAIGMAAHAARWLVLQNGGTIEAAAFTACILVGTVVAPLADRLRVPFAAFAFAAVVSLMPGVLLFEAAADLTALLGAGAHPAPELLLSAVSEATSAFVVVLGMALGLTVPRLCLRG
jgi:uncharacterized membrane protein YjjP (DUF1212 family)